MENLRGQITIQEEYILLSNTGSKLYMLMKENILAKIIRLC